MPLNDFWCKGSNETTIKIGEAYVKDSTEEDLLGIMFDQSLSFKQQVKALCKKASHELRALARISRYIDTEKLQRLMAAFVLSHFSYCPIVVMFHDRALNHGINHISCKGIAHWMQRLRERFWFFSWSNLNRCQSM